MGIITHTQNQIPQGLSGFASAIFGIALVLLLLAFLCSLVLAGLEGFDIWNAFLYVVGLLCGIEDPLTALVPVTDEGNFFAALCSTIELAVGGAIVGLIGGHSKVTYLVFLFEGQTEEEAEGEEEPCDPNLMAGEMKSAGVVIKEDVSPGKDP